MNINLSPNAKYCTIAQIKTISHLCCTTPRISTKLKAIDKNLVPRMSKILFFPLLAKYSQRARPKRNAYFIHKTISVREKIAQIHTNTQRSYCDVMPLLRMVRNCTTVEWYAASQRLSSNRRVHNKLSRCCTIRIVEYESLWDNLGMSDIKQNKLSKQNHHAYYIY